MGELEQQTKIGIWAWGNCHGIVLCGEQGKHTGWALLSHLFTSTHDSPPYHQQPSGVQYWWMKRKRSTSTSMTLGIPLDAWFIDTHLGLSPSLNSMWCSSAGPAAPTQPFKCSQSLFCWSDGPPRNGYVSQFHCRWSTRKATIGFVAKIHDIDRYCIHEFAFLFWNPEFGPMRPALLHLQLSYLPKTAEARSQIGI